MQDVHTLPVQQRAHPGQITSGPSTGRFHTVIVNGGEGHLTFSRNAYGYFTVESLALQGTQEVHPRALFDMERSEQTVENLQAIDPVFSRYTDAVSIDGCVLTSFALHGESPEAVKEALSKVWLVESRTLSA